MNVTDLVAFALLVLFAGFQAWHHWLLLTRQHKQIRELERIIAMREQNEMVGAYLAQDQVNEARRNQPAQPDGLKMRPIS